MAKVGDRVSEYVLEQSLGAGACGEVWRARHHAWHNQLVAVKLPHDSEFIRQLQREGLAVQGLKHPNIVQAIGFDPYADPPYLISEFVVGGSLRELMRNGVMPIARAITVLCDVLAGLGFAHERGIVHRDVKPENILLDENGVAKVSDFGLGTRVQPATSIAYSLSIDGPSAQRVAGTLDYMAPEQRAGNEVDARCDLYAVGVVMFELLTGEKPAGTEVPSDVNPSVPAYLNEVFRRAYARRERRFASATEFATAISAKQSESLPPPLLNRRLACPRCQASVAVGDQFCMHCGVQLVPMIRRCSHCGTYPEKNDQFCMQCGKLIGARKSLPA